MKWQSFDELRTDMRVPADQHTIFAAFAFDIDDESNSFYYWRFSKIYLGESIRDMID